MKRLLLGCFLALSLATMGATIYLPHNTRKIISCDYSTGGGDKMITYLEVLVQNTDGSYHMYTKTITSMSGLIGLGRFTIPNKFDFVIKKNLSNEIKYKA